MHLNVLLWPAPRIRKSQVHGLSQHILCRNGSASLHPKLELRAKFGAGFQSMSSPSYFVDHKKGEVMK